MKYYKVHEQIGNFSDIVFESDNFNEIQDYLEERLVSMGIDIYDESEVEAFYSYFAIEEEEIS